MARQELASFLRDRREALRPTDVGLPAGSHRRTPGLRREEVAGLANMSVEYYARLEQARGPRPSAPILDGVADALRLTPAERAHVFRLAGLALPTPPGPPCRVRPYVARLLERMPDTAAIVTAATYDVIAWNPLAEALMGDLRGRNLARRCFLRREETILPSGQEDFGEIAVARLRAAADRYPRDHGLAALLAELRGQRGIHRDLGHASGACAWPPDEDDVAPAGRDAARALRRAHRPRRRPAGRLHHR
jgi:transcriptional regulator with XRE-family HTH domain